MAGRSTKLLNLLCCEDANIVAPTKTRTTSSRQHVLLVTILPDVSSNVSFLSMYLTIVICTRYTGQPASVKA
jgi:hypothetical protein